MNALEFADMPTTQQEMQVTKERVSKVAIGTISALLVVKIVAAILTGSIGLAADAIHSLIDLTGAVIGFFGVRIAGKPPDERHRFGHGRAEDIAGASIATLIFIAAGIIAYEAIHRLISGATVQMVETGIFATAIAIAINMSVARYVLTIAKASDSVALEATGRDLMADVMSSVAVLVGLILVRAAGEPLLDPIVALLVVVLIIRTAAGTMRKAISNLMDTELPEEEVQAIQDMLAGKKSIANYHALRTRKAGSQRYIQVHIVVPRNKTVEEGHQIAEDMEDDIRALFHGSAVTIHVEPCTPDCAECPTPCENPTDRSKPQ
ncbi:MAG: cation transporter [Dehalococcoidia bacterium]|nr:cation transporter [Dehalococcoidia bacterium]